MNDLENKDMYPRFWDDSKNKSQCDYFKEIVRKYNNTNKKIPWTKINNDFYEWYYNGDTLNTDWNIQKNWISRNIEKYIMG